MIELVSDNPNPNPDRERLKSDLEDTLRDLAANILRICATGGRPGDIFPQAHKFVEAYSAYLQNIGAYDDNDIVRHALWINKEVDANPLYPSYLADNITLEERHKRRRQSDVAEAEEHMIIGALRVAAARLRPNATQEHKGHYGMLEAARQREEAIKDKYDPKKEAKMVSGGPTWTGHRQVIKPQEPKPPKPKSWKQKLQEKEEDEGKRLTLALALQAAEKSMKAFMKRQRRPDGSRPSFYELRETDPEPVRLEFAELQKEVEKAKAELDHFDQNGEQRR
jgi:hypothetical protein